MSTPLEHTSIDRKFSSPAHSDALANGARLDEFEIKSLLGVGGFGMVYLAFDHSLHREVAIKEYMPTALAARSQRDTVAMRSSGDNEAYEAGLRSFIAEARLLAQFDHPSLVKVFRFWEANNTAYMVMPLYRGITLKEARVQMRQPPSEAWLRKVVWSILQALKVLHGANTMHRDVSPDNIFLQDVGPPVLLDLGAARRALTDKTQKFTAILKVNYAPIEQYADSLDMRQGPWTDLYALAAVVHGCLTSEPPPPATFRVLKDRLLSVHDIAQTIAEVLGERYSPAFCAAMDHALQVLPQERPQSAADFETECALQAVPGMSRFDWRAELGNNWLPSPQQALPESYAPTQLLTQAFTRKSTEVIEEAVQVQAAAFDEKTVLHTRSESAGHAAAPEPEPQLKAQAATPSKSDGANSSDNSDEKNDEKNDKTNDSASVKSTVKNKGVWFAAVAAGIALAIGALWSVLQNKPTAESAPAASSTQNAVSVPTVAASHASPTAAPASSAPVSSAAASALASGSTVTTATVSSLGKPLAMTSSNATSSATSTTATLKSDAKTATGQVKAAIAGAKSMLASKPTASAAAANTGKGSASTEKSANRAGEKAAEKVRQPEPVGADQTTKPAATGSGLCADSNFLSRPMCIHNECQKAQNAKLAVCVENNLRYKDQQPAATR